MVTVSVFLNVGWNITLTQVVFNILHWVVGASLWEGITAHLRTPLVVIDGKFRGVQDRHEVIRPDHVLSFIRDLGRHVTLQQDNGRTSVACVVTDFTGQNILTFP